MDMTTIIETIMSYGALGAVAAYLAVKDWKLTEKVTVAIDNNTAALSELKTAVKLVEKEVEG